MGLRENVTSGVVAAPGACPAWAESAEVIDSQGRRSGTAATSQDSHTDSIALVVEPAVSRNAPGSATPRRPPAGDPTPPGRVG